MASVPGQRKPRLMLGLAEGTAVPKSVVCGVDGTDESRDAALVAAAMAHALDARLVLGYIAHGLPVWSGGDASVEVRHHEVAIEACTASLVGLTSALGLNDACSRVAFAIPRRACSLSVSRSARCCWWSGPVAALRSRPRSSMAPARAGATAGGFRGHRAAQRRRDSSCRMRTS